MLGSHLFASEDYKPSYPLLNQKKEEIDIDEKYVLAINDSPAFGDNKLRGYKLSEQLGETDESPFQFDFTSVGHIYNQIANIEKLAMLVDVYLFPLIAGEVKNFLPYNSCVWKYSFLHNCYVASKNYGKGVCLYLGTKEELMLIMARKAKIFRNEVLRCSSDPCYLENVAFQRGETELVGTFICRED